MWPTALVGLGLLTLIAGTLLLIAVEVASKADEINDRRGE